MSSSVSSVLDMSMPATEANVASARRFVVDTLTAWHADDVAEDAELLVSELVTNAVRYDGPRVGVELRLAGGTLRVSVEDGSPAVGRNAALPNAGDDEEHGRGLAIVDALAREWGVESLTSGGKYVWFELDVTIPA